MVFDINLEIPGKMWFFQRIKANQHFLTQKILALFAPKVTLWFGISRLAANFPKNKSMESGFYGAGKTPKISKVEKKKQPLPDQKKMGVQTKRTSF